MSKILMTKGAAPSTPGTGKVAIWPDTNGILQLRNDAGLDLPGGIIRTGTWVPVFADANSGGNVATPATNDGGWIRIGPFTIINWRTLSISTAGMTAGNGMVLRNLPFAINSTIPGPFMANVRFNNVTFTDYVMPIISTATVINFNQTISGSSALSLLVSAFTSGSANCIGAICYITNDA